MSQFYDNTSQHEDHFWFLTLSPLAHSSNKTVAKQDLQPISDNIKSVRNYSRLHVVVDNARIDFSLPPEHEHEFKYM